MLLNSYCTWKIIKICFSYLFKKMWLRTLLIYFTSTCIIDHNKVYKVCFGNLNTVEMRLLCDLNGSWWACIVQSENLNTFSCSVGLHLYIFSWRIVFVRVEELPLWSSLRRSLKCFVIKHLWLIIVQKYFIVSDDVGLVKTIWNIYGMHFELNWFSKFLLK